MFTDGPGHRCDGCSAERLSTVMASHRRGDGQSRPAPGTPRHLGPVAAGGGDREQSATTEGTASGLDAKADFRWITRHHGGQHEPLPAALAIGIASFGIAGRGT